LRRDRRPLSQSPDRQDTTQVCEEQGPPQRGQIDKIEFRDLNGDGYRRCLIPGFVRNTQRIQTAAELCQEAQAGKTRRPHIAAECDEDYRIDPVRWIAIHFDEGERGCGEAVRREE